MSGFLQGLTSHFAGSDAPLDALPEEIADALKQELAASKLLRPELLALWNHLGTTLGAAGYSRPSGDTVSLLNLACGPCFEAAVLAAWFGQPGAIAGARNRVRFFGMDLRGQEIEKAERRYAATESVFKKLAAPVLTETDTRGSSIEFFADDATRLVGYREIPQEFDIIFIRHQNVWNDRPAWRKIFAFALDSLKPETGRLVITSYFDREHLIALDTLRSLGGHVVTTAANPNSIPLPQDHPDKSCDRHIAVLSQEDL